MYIALCDLMLPLVPPLVCGFILGLTGHIFSASLIWYKRNLTLFSTNGPRLIFVYDKLTEQKYSDVSQLYVIV